MSEEITFVLHLESWIKAKQNISGLANIKKKSRDSESKEGCNAKEIGDGEDGEEKQKGDKEEVRDKTDG